MTVELDMQRQTITVDGVEVSLELLAYMANPDANKWIRLVRLDNNVTGFAEIKNRVRIMNDDDGHSYLVPVEAVREFEAHLESVYNEQDDDIAPMPDGVEALDSHLSCYSFVDPRRDG